MVTRAGWITFGVMLAGSACTGVDAEPVDAQAADAEPVDAEPEPVEFTVHVGTPEGIYATVDGEVLVSSDPFLRVTFPDYATARDSPLYRLETWREEDGQKIDSADIGFGACKRWCEQMNQECQGNDTRVERNVVCVDTNGGFPNSALDPRAFWGCGCLFCTFEDGVEWAVCT